MTLGFVKMESFKVRTHSDIPRVLYASEQTCKYGGAAALDIAEHREKTGGGDAYRL
jgi:hypothetical protein